MQCPKCAMENRQDALFCLRCGTGLGSPCPACQTPNPPTRKFCSTCGVNLKPSPPVFYPCFLEKPPSFSVREADPTLAPSRNKRHYVTVLFTDLSGYTSMSEKMDPEELSEIMVRIFDRITQIIHKFGGFVDSYVGDAVLAFFGVPEAQENDPVRAIAAAREIHAIIKTMSAEKPNQIGHPLAMHTGIDTGFVVIGGVKIATGSLGAVGDAVNVANRLATLAYKDEIVVGPDTYRSAREYFSFQALKWLAIKGKPEPVRPYKLVSPKKLYRASQVNGHT